jgi:hypothetical protein
MVIAVLALVAAVTGAAVASPTASTSTLTKKDKKKVRSIADAEIAKLAPGLTVKSASSANSANTANSLTMYGLISSSGGLSNARGIGGVSALGGGFFCLSGLAATPKGGVATVDYNDSLFEDVQIGLGDLGGSCPAGTQAFVWTHTGNTSGNAGVFVTLW